MKVTPKMCFDNSIFFNKTNLYFAFWYLAEFKFEQCDTYICVILI